MPMLEARTYKTLNGSNLAPWLQNDVTNRWLIKRGLQNGCYNSIEGSGLNTI